MRSGFPGFPPEAVTFYRGLARHNTREWFQPRKTVYDEKVKAPMVELVTELNRAMMAFAPDYVTEAPNAIYRIYRDTRFSPDKTPYKTQIAASFARRGMEKHGAAGYYFAISHKGVDVGGGIYFPPPETLAAGRPHRAGKDAGFPKIGGFERHQAAVRRGAWRAAFARAQGLLRRSSRGGSAALQAIPAVHHAGSGPRHHAEAVRRVGKTLPRADAVFGVFERAFGGEAAATQAAGPRV